MIRLVIRLSTSIGLAISLGLLWKRMVALLQALALGDVMVKIE